jgi:hypothetical protein
LSRISRISKGHSKCIIQINWQHRLHKKKKRRKKNKNNNTMCVGHHYTQTNTNNGLYRPIGLYILGKGKNKIGAYLIMKTNMK